MTIILGPVPCQGCRRLVTWNGWEWQEMSGRHACARHGPLAGRGTVGGRQQDAPPVVTAGRPTLKRSHTILASASLSTCTDTPARGTASSGHDRAAEPCTSQTLRNPSCGRKAGRGGKWGNGRPGPSHRYVLSEGEERQTHTAPLPRNGGRVPRSGSASGSAYRRLS